MQGKYLTHLSRSAMGLMLVFLALSVTMILFIYSHWITHFETEMPVMSNLNQIEVDLSQAHLWVEEALTGDKEDLDKAWKLMDESDSLMADALEKAIKIQGGNHSGLTETLIKIQDKKGHFHQMAINRISNPGNQGIGTDADKVFDALFKELLNIISLARLETIQLMVETKQVLVSRFIFLVIAWSILLFAALLFYFKARSESKQRWLALKQSEQKKTLILDHAQESIISIDRDGCIIEFNKEAERMFGHKIEDVIGRPMAEIIIPETLRDKHLKAFS